MVSGPVLLEKPSRFPAKQSREPGIQIIMGIPSHGRKGRLMESVGKRGEQMKKGVRAG